MPKPKAPRHGSMQFWPRKRATRPYARIRNIATDAKGLTTFAGYKAGMTHVLAIDTNKNSQTKNETIAIPATILECPTMRMHSVRGYTHDVRGLRVAQEIIIANKDKYLGRKVSVKSTHPSLPDSFSAETYDRISITLFTQPDKTGIGQKKPQLFEIQLGGTLAEQLETAKSLIGKDIKASELFKEGDLIDLHAITKGYGYQGPVKRFGIGLKPHKSEKGRRRPGVIAGGWSAQQHTMYRVAFAGQMGYHQRTQYNNQILKITDKPEELMPKGGLTHYGTLRAGNEYVLIRGSVPGPKKRMVTLVKAIRSKKNISLPTVEYVSLESQQGK